METPKIEKREIRPYDYQEMTWAKFIALREWAKDAYQQTGYPFYLVGSSLHKEKPRDFDIVMIIPLNDYTSLFGELNESSWAEIAAKAFNHYSEHYFSCCEVFGEFGFVPLDFKIYPDNWFVNEDKVLIS